MTFVDDDHVRTITFTSEDIAAMEAVLTDDKNKPLPPFWQRKYRADQAKNWECFYRRNTTNFYKDRSWLSREFGLDALSRIAETKEAWTLVDIGCGVGNGMFPILRSYHNVEVYAYDVSPKAVEFVLARYIKEKTAPPGAWESSAAAAEEEEDIFEEYDETAKSTDAVRCGGDGRMGRLAQLGVWNFISDSAPTTCNDIDEPTFALKESAFTKFHAMDAGILLFVLSAIPPESVEIVIERIGSLIKPGGYLMFRDYGRYDQKEVRFASRADAKLDDHFYVRQDGTLALYFDKDTLDRMFVTIGGFEIITSQYITRQFVNRKTRQTLNRCWIQSVFRKASPCD